MKKSAKKTKGKKVSIQPLADRVLVHPEDSVDEKSPFGIIIPDTARKEKPERGVVMAVGAGKRGDDGKVIPLSVKVGDTIIFDKYGFTEVKLEDKEFYIVSESSILAILK